jgi:hypothetical protein
MFAYNYYNVLTWSYKFHRDLFLNEPNFFITNSDLSIRIRLRRLQIFYSPFLSKTFQFSIFSNPSFVNFYLVLNSKFKQLSDFSALEVSNFNIHSFKSSLVINKFFFGLDIVYSSKKLDTSQLLLMGSYDPISNNFYDSKFLEFYTPKILSSTAVTALYFLQNFFVLTPFEFFLKFYFNFFYYK